MRSNMWLDIIVHTLSAFITLITYIHCYFLYQSFSGSKPSHNRFPSSFILPTIYLTIVAIWCSLSCYVSYVHVKSPEDGDRLFPWWIGAGLSFVNFTTVNVYNQPIFSRRLLVEFLTGFLVFVTQVCQNRRIMMHDVVYFFSSFGAVLLFRNVQHCGINSRNSGIGSNSNSVRFRNYNF